MPNAQNLETEVLHFQSRLHRLGHGHSTYQTHCTHAQRLAHLDRVRPRPLVPQNLETEVLHFQSRLHRLEDGHKLELARLRKEVEYHKRLRQVRRASYDNRQLSATCVVRVACRALCVLPVCVGGGGMRKEVEYHKRLRQVRRVSHDT